MWELTELEALQKLFDTKFDSNLEDLLTEDELFSSMKHSYFLFIKVLLGCF